MTCTNESCDCRGFEYGDIVEHRVMLWPGVIVGDEEYGTKMKVIFRVGAVRYPLTVDVAEIALVDYEDEPVKGAEDNVIHVNFTKKPKGGLKKDTPTDGAA